MMRTLAIDIETTPNLAHVWGLWNQNVSPTSQLVEPTEMLSFAAKWIGERGPVVFHGGRHFASAQGDDDGMNNDQAHFGMVSAAWDLLDAADAVVHYNGKRFDVPHMNREFLTLGMDPPSPYRQVDLLDTMRRRFKFPSNKLAYVTKALGFKGKIGVDFELWRQCMAGDLAAWARMERYNRRDVLELIELYDRLTPWIVGAPNAGLDPANDGKHLCPSCGSAKVQKRGFSYTGVSRFQQYQCSDCGRYSRSGKRLAGVDLRAVSE